MGKRNIYENNEDPDCTPFKKQKILHSPPSSPNDSLNKQEFVLTRDLVDNTILLDLMQSQWRIGKPIGKGSFGEIFLASDNINQPVTTDNAKYVAKIEPHSNGPLFVEIHCLLNTAKTTPEVSLPPGMPEYIASGSHHFQSNRYRFLILQRFKCDLHSVIKKRRVNVKHVLIIATQVLDVLEHLHDNGYAHSDIKSENLMIGSCTIDKSPIKIGLMDHHKDLNSNPMRPCRTRKHPEMGDFIFGTELNSRRKLRPLKNVKYNYDDDDTNDVDADDARDFDFDFGKKAKRTKKLEPTQTNINKKSAGKKTVDHIYLIDFGLASKFVDSNGVHHAFCMDQRRAHDGTLEFTSRDAHMGAHSRRSDLECLGYNIMLWCLGCLPWKDEKLQNQPEQVHRMKEIFMSEPREMLRLIYGQEVPKFLGEYFHYVNSLAYDERPCYDQLRLMFQQEFVNLGFKKADMVLKLDDLKKGCIELTKAVKSADNHSDKIKNVKAIAKLGLLIPLNERMSCSRNGSIGCRVSPKNLRSKSEKLPKKSKKRFSWAEILSQDPDQIARQRAEKEFERDQMTETPIKYKGRPTYAILEIENRLKSKDNNNESRNICQDEDYIKGYTKAMMDVVRKRVASLAAIDTSVDKSERDEIDSGDQKSRPGRRKSGNPTKLCTRTNNKNKSASQIHDNFYIRPKKGRKSDVLTQQLTPPNTTDESSCSSASSDNLEEAGAKKRSSGNSLTKKQLNERYSKKNGSTGTNSRSSSQSSLHSIVSNDSIETSYTTSGISSSEFYDNDDDSYDMNDFSPIQTRKTRQKLAGKKRGRPLGSKNVIKNTQKLASRV